MKRIISMILVVVLIGTAITGFSGNARAWEASVSHGPSSVTEGDTVAFHITVQNTGSKSMKVTEVGIRFDWMEDGYYYFSKDVPQVIASGAEYEFYITVDIPKNIPTDVSHVTEIEVDASDPGWLSDWGTPSSNTYNGNTYVNEYIPPDTGGDTGGGDNNGGSTPSIGVPLIMVGFLVSMTAIVIRKKYF